MLEEQRQKDTSHTCSFSDLFALYSPSAITSYSSCMCHKILPETRCGAFKIQFSDFAFTVFYWPVIYSILYQSILILSNNWQPAGERLQILQRRVFVSSRTYCIMLHRLKMLSLEMYVYGWWKDKAQPLLLKEKERTQHRKITLHIHSSSESNRELHT